MSSWNKSTSDYPSRKELELSVRGVSLGSPCKSLSGMVSMAGDKSIGLCKSCKSVEQVTTIWFFPIGGFGSGAITYLCEFCNKHFDKVKGIVPCSGGCSRATCKLTEK